MGALVVRFFPVSLVLWVAGSMALGAGIDFEKDIRPILSEKCTLCHGPDESKAGLRLTGIEHATKVLESGRRGIVPEEPEHSEILHRVRASDPDETMPPPDKGEALTATEVAKLEQWIAGGAVWPKHWAYAGLAEPRVPLAPQARSVKNPVDAFVFARLAAEGITPSPEANDITLIRRFFYDLIGLPPTVEQTATYRAAIAADREAGLARLADDLLASPAFGERWGRHWLDRARFADSDGFEKDNHRPDAWRYRDWVINAINTDMPFDRFTIEQFAGDLLENATPEQVLATAFHRQTLTNTEGGVDKEQWRVAAVMDRVETMGAVWMGLTLTCARCHTHKYDEITHAEYYQLFSYLNNSDETNAKVRESDQAWARYKKALANHVEILKDLEAKISVAREELKGRVGEWEQRLGGWLAEAKAITEPERKTITVENFAAPKGVRFSLEADQSVLVGGTNPPVATYTITAKLPPGRVTGLRLEVLPDPSLSQNGPGRAKHGNFVLNRVSLSVKGHPRNPIRLGDAAADYAQDDWAVSGILDDNVGAGKNGTGWAIGGGVGKAHFADIGFAEPIESSEATEFTLQLVQNYGGQHTIGRFRLSAMTAPTVLAVPERVRLALATRADRRTPDMNTAILRHVEQLDGKTWPLLAQKAAHEAKRPLASELEVRVLTERKTDRRKTHVLKRGEFKEPLDEVHPATLAVLPPIRHRGERGDRLDLARWLVSGENPLPPRVIVNDIWAQLFGTGLVPTPDDFGARGDRPSHPALLEWLALELIRTGWSRKALIRTIVLSETYRQASRHRPELLDRDPKNRLLARQNRFRVEAEIIRDLSLAASGLLSKKVGGPSVFPPIPAGVADVNYNSAFKWVLSEGEDRYRRGLYTYFKRTAPHPALITFDCPDSNVTSLQRARSNTPLAALITLNSESFVEAAQALARRVLSEKAGADDKARVEHAFRLCLSRNPDLAERDRLVRLLKRSRTWYRERTSEAGELAGKNLPDGLAPDETAAWVSTVRVLLNLDEFLTRG